MNYSVISKHLVPNYKVSVIIKLLYIQSPDERGIFIQILESGYRFALGSVGGGEYN